MNCSDLEKYLQNLPEDKPRKFTICFSKKLHFQDYISYKVMIWKLNLPFLSFNSFPKEYIY
jgi:hypothetical protein